MFAMLVKVAIAFVLYQSTGSIDIADALGVKSQCLDQSCKISLLRKAALPLTVVVETTIIACNKKIGFALVTSFSQLPNEIHLPSIC